MNHNHQHHHAHGHVQGHAHGTIEEALENLKASGLKTTRTRKALLTILVREHGPFTIEELQQRLEAAGSSCDIVTIYRNMTNFEEAGMVRSCDFGDGSARFEWALGEHAHHHHIICQNCRKIEELELCVVEELEQLVSKRGYSQVSHRLEFYGICTACQSKNN